MNIPNGNDNIINKSLAVASNDERWQIQTSANTGLYLYNSSATSTVTNYTSLLDELVTSNTYVYRKPSAFRKSKKIKGDLTSANDPKNRIKVLPPVAVFQFVKKRFTLLEQSKLSVRLERVCQLLEIAKDCNQIALQDKINEKFGRFLKEQEMISCGFTQFIEKEYLQMFVNRCSKQNVLKLTKLKNYIRLIPKDIRKRLEKAQKTNLFDDYIILHTDPDNKAVEKTKEEKKDPILFGIIAESNRYYVIGDWVDEFCDITMDKIIATLDLEQNDVTLETNVENAFLETFLSK